MVRAAMVVLVLVLAGCAGSAPAPEAVQSGDEFWIAGIVVTEAIVPIGGATVTLQGVDLSNVTDAKGAFVIGPLEAGNYRLSVKAAGYADTVLQAQAASQDVLLKIVLKAVGTNVPYHEIEHFVGYLECTFDTWVAPYQILGAPCFGVIDLVTGVTVSWDRWQFVWEVTAPGLEGILIEMIWEEQATGSQMGLLLRNVAGAGSGVDAGGTNIDTQYASNRGPSPMQTWVYQGIENPGADDGALFQDPQNESMEYKILILGRADYSQPADVHLMLQNEPEVFLTKFYNAMGDPSYSVL